MIGCFVLFRPYSLFHTVKPLFTPKLNSFHLGHFFFPNKIMSAGAWPQAGYVSEPNEMCLGLCNPSLLHHNGNIHVLKKKKKSSAHHFTLMLTARSTASANVSHEEHLASVSMDLRFSLSIDVTPSKVKLVVLMY